MQFMYYQLEYDKVFIVTPFYYKEKNEWIDDLTITLRFDPVFFVEKGKEPTEQTIQLENTRSSLAKLVRIAFDSAKGEIMFHEHEEIKGKYKVISYVKGVCNEPKGSSCFIGENPVEITKEEFYFIIKNYNDYIENDSSLQTTAYSWNEIKKIPKNTVIENQNKKHSNPFINSMEDKLNAEKEKHEQALENRQGATSMKSEYAGRALEYMNVTCQLENQKDFLLNQKNYEQDKLLDIYVELINQWGLFTHFISRKEIYNYAEGVIKNEK